MHVLQILLQIAAILLLGRLLGRLLRRVGQPTVIAEIVAGIALGPSALGLVSPAAMEALFPKDTLGTLGIVSQVGLVFFMFLVGLEFDPRLLQGQARASIAVSNAGILVPFVLGLGLAVGLHGTLAPEGVGFWPFALFLGTAMSVTAFPVLARILTERRLIRTRVGALALAAAAVDDVSAWCLLALVVGIASAGGVGAAFGTTALALAYSAFIWFGVRPVLARVGPRQGQVISTDVIAFVMLAVVLSAAATEWIGIHALFGAFLVGAAMPRSGGLTASLAEKMEDFVTVVLLPVFFAFSGLRTQIQLLSGPEDWAMCAAVVAVAIAGKFGGATIAGRITGLGWRDAGALGVLMNTRGLMELVVLNVGLDLGVISPRLFAMMVVMALVTTWMAAPILSRLYPTGRVLGDLPPAPAPALAAGPLVCVSDPARAASLVRVARAWVGARDVLTWALHLRPTERPQDYLREEPARREDEVITAIDQHATAVGLRLEAIVFPSASPADDIVGVAATKAVPLILLGVHKTTFGLDSLRGVVADVVEGAACTVGVLLDRGVGELRRVALHPGDGPDDQAARALVDALIASGVERVDQGADLIVSGWRSALPTDGGVSRLLVRAGRSA